MGKRISIFQLTLLFLIVFILLSIFIKGQGVSELIITHLSVATFLFGIFVAYVMGNRYARWEKLTEIFVEDKALYVGIYKISGVFGKKMQQSVQKLIDNYLTSTMDYPLKLYYLTAPKFLELYNFLVNIKPKGDHQLEAYSSLVEMANEANKNRNTIENLVRSSIMKFEWTISIFLWVVILGTIFYLNNNSLISIIIVVLLATSSTVFLLIIRDLNDLVWREQEWNWDPGTQMFKELDLLPYFPHDLIELKRAKISRGTKIRLAYYPDNFPSLKRKKIKTITIK